MRLQRLFNKHQRAPFKSIWLFIVIALIGWISCSITYFIYTVPGTANTYLYRFHLMRHSFYDSMKHASVDAFQRMVRNSAMNEYYEKPVSTKTPPVTTTTTYLPPGFTYLPNQTCPEKFPEMTGPFYVNMTEIPLSDIYKNYSNVVKMGGKWKPNDCTPKYKVAFLIPFRNRHQHLPILLRHLLPMLLKQHLDFTIFLVEQSGAYPFNRAMLFNVGFKEAMKRDKFDCFVFHDVDHIPENDRTYYGCSGMPKHYATQLDIHLYHLEYEKFFGGVSGCTTQQFKKVNGFTNQFWGWGGEDDDFYTRIKQGGFNVSRPPDEYGRYQSIKKNHGQEAQFLGRFSLLKHSADRNFVDGLNSLQYRTPIITQTRFYTNITVDLRPIKDLPSPTDHS